MPLRVTRKTKQFAVDTKGSVVIIAVFALPVLLAISALALEYGSALLTKAENQRISDIAAFAAAFEYNKKMKDSANNTASAAKAAAKSIAALNGVSSGVTVTFDNPVNATYIDVVISEEQPVFLSRLLRPNDHLTVNTTSRVSLGEASGFVPCIVVLNANEGFTVNGGSGEYNMTGCGIGSNGTIETNGQTLATSCATPSFKMDEKTCLDEVPHQDGFTDPFAALTNWPDDPNNSEERKICDFIGTFPDDMSTRSGNSYQLKPGVLCVDEFSSKFGSVFSEYNSVSSESSGGNVIIVKAGVDFNRSGNFSFSLTPSMTGDFAGVAIYAPKSSFTVGGNPDFSIDGLGCSGIIVGSMVFNGNVTFNAECDENDVNYGAGAGDPVARPRLVR
ncbi:putative Flp pilus-assembly TadE/G-like [Roseinatronobacter thiooxidans]|uniref:Putative Flp pilus-assembly TadE/G-like n=1 Tax=Roseinatronobacter thiooxidans TaxID=121821 RepID=A0A2W7QCD3_9RHOB|nr:Tad domain-containing protein [Roseinatronobacter thiooxidans]PZX36205.1 putative Flp pilus-assembly TadE/G-like [Roseinatronobacter thiooxidans]